MWGWSEYNPEPKDPRGKVGSRQYVAWGQLLSGSLPCSTVVALQGIAGELRGWSYGCELMCSLMIAPKHGPTTAWTGMWSIRTSQQQWTSTALQPRQGQPAKAEPRGSESNQGNDPSDWLHLFIGRIVYSLSVYLGGLKASWKKLTCLLGSLSGLPSTAQMAPCSTRTVMHIEHDVKSAP